MRARDRFHSHQTARWLIVAFAVVIVLAFVAALLWKGQEANARTDSEQAIAGGEFSDSERAAIEALVRNYILEHPEVLPEAIERLQARQSQEQLAAVAGDVAQPFPGAVLGNEQGSKVLISFTDYACGYCRMSVDDVKALIAGDDDLKVVIRELPILSQNSVEAAKIALAAAKQGKYEEFHNRLYALGGPSAENVAAAARSVGLDLAQARIDAESPAIAAEIERNREIAAQLQIDGTPTWIAGGQVLQGAVGEAALRKALSTKAG